MYIFNIFIAPPEAQTIVRESENLDIRLEYVSVFSNMLQIDVFIRNKNNRRLTMHDVRLRSTSVSILL